MIIFRSLPALMSALILAAHFFRAQNVILTAACIGVFVLMLASSRVAPAVRIFLFMGSIEWMRTMIVLILQRESLGEPWMRMAVILSIVALFTLGSSFTLPWSKSRYGRDCFKGDSRNEVS